MSIRAGRFVSDPDSHLPRDAELPFWLPGDTQAGYEARTLRQLRHRASRDRDRHAAASGVSHRTGTGRYADGGIEYLHPGIARLVGTSTNPRTADRRRQCSPRPRRDGVAPVAAYLLRRTFARSTGDRSLRPAPRRSRVTGRRRGRRVRSSGLPAAGPRGRRRTVDAAPGPGGEYGGAIRARGSRCRAGTPGEILDAPSEPDGPGDPPQRRSGDRPWARGEVAKRLSSHPIWASHVVA